MAFLDSYLAISTIIIISQDNNRYKLIKISKCQTRIRVKLVLKVTKSDFKFIVRYFLLLNVLLYSIVLMYSYDIKMI
jgi:hypothetical protein